MTNHTDEKLKLQTLLFWLYPTRNDLKIRKTTNHHPSTHNRQSSNNTASSGTATATARSTPATPGPASAS